MKISLENRSIHYAVLLIGLLPIWFTTFPPMVDLPQHSAEVQFILQKIFSDNCMEFNLLTPYIIPYAFQSILQLVLPALFAGKLFVSLAFISLFIATRKLLKNNQGNIALSLTLIPLTYNFAYYFGFSNFIFTIPFFLILLERIIKFTNSKNEKYLIHASILCLALSFFHLMLAGIALVILAWTLFVGKGSNLMLRKLAYITVNAGIFLYLASGVGDRNGLKFPEFNTSLVRLEDLMDSLFMSKDMSINFILSIIFVVLIATSRFKKEIFPYFILFIILFVILFFPSGYANVSFIYERFVILLCPVFCLVTEHRNKLFQNILIFFLVSASIISTFSIHYQYEKESLAFQDVFNTLVPGEKLIYSTPEDNSRFVDLPVYRHLPQWYSTIKGGYAIPNFSTISHMPVLNGENCPRITVSEQRFSPDEYLKLEYDDFRYLIVRKKQIENEELLKLNYKFTLVKHVENWWLFDRKSE